MKTKEKELELLKEAFEKFVKASESLKKSYESLKKKYLSLEKELKITNKKLKESLKEKEKLSSYLKSIIESMNSGVICFKENGEITLFNDFSKNYIKDIEKIKSINELPVNEFKEFISKCVSSKKRIEKEVKTKNGKHFLLSCGLIKKSSVEHFFLFKDITELKELEEEAKRKSRLSEMGEMAAEIAHEIRNPLGAIELYASMIEEDIDKNSSAYNYISSIRSEVKRLNSLLTNILLFTREFKIEKRKVSVKWLIESINEIVEPIMNSKGINYSAKSSIDFIFADGDLLKRAIVNLLLNSSQAVEKKKDKKISLSITKKNNLTLIKVKDNGIGIDDDVVDKIFNPFFTTKPKGSGLGLAVVYRIISAHEGKIGVKSKKGEFTEFQIKLPSLS